MNFIQTFCFVTLLLTFIHCLHYDDIDWTSVYYRPKSHDIYPILSIDNQSIEIANDKSTSKSRGPFRRINYRSNGCTCQQLTCGCCLGINLQQFNLNREGCMNFTYDPLDFAVNMNMLMDGSSVFSNAFSAKNPPPLCMPLPIPYLPISVEACARLFDIHTPGRNLHMCFDFETRVQKATVLILHFDCMRMGNDGLALTKPGDPLPISSTTENQIDSDIYDEVTEIKRKN